jgi:hypothetical protein
MATPVAKLPESQNELYTNPSFSNKKLPEEKDPERLKSSRMKQMNHWSASDELVATGTKHSGIWWPGRAT